MATLRESGEAWIAAGQVEYGQMLIEAAATIERQAREIDALKERAAYRGKSFAKAIQDYNEMRDQKNAELAEVERLDSERNFWHRKWRRDWQALEAARAAFWSW